MTSGSASNISHNSWSIDSGASSHMSGTPSLFSSLSLSSSIAPVSIVDASHSPIFGIGIINPSPSLTLSDVLYAPKFSINLLSVSRLT